MFSPFFNFWLSKLKSVGIVYCLILEHLTIPTIFSLDEVIFQLYLMVWFCTKLYILARYGIRTDHLYVCLALYTGSCIIERAKLKDCKEIV
jgi:hypothetical protein